MISFYCSVLFIARISDKIVTGEASLAKIAAMGTMPLNIVSLVIESKIL